MSVLHLQGTVAFTCSKGSFPDIYLKLADEAPLIYSHMFVIDGNNSAKRFMSAGLQDDREFHSDYFLTREEVDRFKDEVKSHPRPPKDPYESEAEVRICVSLLLCALSPVLCS